MNWLMNVVMGLQIVTAIVMVALVLMQHGKGADMGASFGSGASGSLFGATGSANFLSRSTSACAAIFFCCTLGLAYLANLREAPSAVGSVLDAPSAPASGAAQIPGTASDVLPATTAAPTASTTASGVEAIPK
jgi:preprotein translocase subunit SecG